MFLFYPLFFILSTAFFLHFYFCFLCFAMYCHQCMLPHNYETCALHVTHHMRVTLKWSSRQTFKEKLGIRSLGQEHCDKWTWWGIKPVTFQSQDNRPYRCSTAYPQPSFTSESFPHKFKTRQFNSRKCILDNYKLD